MGLSSGPHGGPHVGLVFVRNLFTGLVDHSGSPNLTPGFHVDAVTGNGDQCPGRGCIVIDEYMNRNG